MRTILIRERAQVKATRRSARVGGPFGAGLLRSLPTYRADHTAVDAEWWARESAEIEARREERELDRRAVEAKRIERLCQGWRD